MENQTPPPLEPLTQPPQQSGSISIGAIIRDVVIVVVVLTGIGGFVIGLSGGLRSSTGMIAIGISNLLLGTRRESSGSPCFLWRGSAFGR